MLFFRMLLGVFAAWYNVTQYSLVHSMSATYTTFAGNFNKALVSDTMSPACLPDAALMMRLPPSSYRWPSALRSFRKGSPERNSGVTLGQSRMLSRAQVWGHVMLLATLGNIGSFTVTGPQRPGCFRDAASTAVPPGGLTMHSETHVGRWNSVLSSPRGQVQHAPAEAMTRLQLQTRLPKSSKNRSCSIALFTWTGSVLTFASSTS